MEWTSHYLTLDSQDGETTPEKGVLRFYIDCPLKQVRDVEWMAFEHSMTDALTIDDRSDALYFSEDGQYFKATLPHGSYTGTSLPEALQSAMACAISVHDNNTRPCNQYTVRVLPDSGRVSIFSGSGNTLPFAVHTFQGSMNIRSFRWLNLTEAQLTVDVAMIPIARGNIVDIVRPHTHPLRVQVVHTLYSTILVRVVVVGTANANANANANATRGDDDVIVYTDHRLQGWTLCSSHDETMLPELLGLGNKDLWSADTLPILHSSNPLVGISPINHKTMHLAVGSPHGCVEGDVVTLDGFEGAGAGFLNGHRAYVTQVVSEQQLIVRVDASIMGAFLPSHRPLHCILRNKNESLVKDVDVGDVLRVEAHDNTVTVTFQGEFPKNDSGWSPVRLLGPVPWRGWLQNDGVFLKRGVSEVALRYHPFRHATTSNTSLQRSGVVGARKMNLLQKQSILLMRLRLGRTEACGVVALKKNNMHVFGRVQMFQSHIAPTSSSSHHALVGKSSFHPPLERVPYVDVCFLTPSGSVLLPSMLGDFSLLLRCVMSCKYET